jgi:hypothetical protein
VRSPRATLITAGRPKSSQAGGPIASIADLKNRTLALGSRDSEHTAMRYDNPAHREILDAEGRKRWLTPHLDGLR